jgi:hypothetical protein
MGNNEEITEKTYSVQDLEIGGDTAQILDIKKITTEMVYWVKEFTINETEWGKRIDFIIHDGYSEWRISSWAFVMKKKIKVLNLVGQKISLKPFSDKKLLLTPLENIPTA